MGSKRTLSVTYALPKRTVFGRHQKQPFAQSQRIHPSSAKQTSMQSAANVGSPPLLSIDTNGPLLPLTVCPNAAVQLPKEAWSFPILSPICSGLIALSQRPNVTRAAIVQQPRVFHWQALSELWGLRDGSVGNENPLLRRHDG
jgi:hypothetical protein